MFGFSEPGLVPGKGEGLFLRNRRLRRDEITDGTSTTMAVAERSGFLAKPTWTGAVTGAVVRLNERFLPDPDAPPIPSERAPVLVLGSTGTVDEAHLPNNSLGHAADIHSQHVEGANVLFVDGSVRLIRSTIRPAVWVALGTRAHGEAINGEDF
jgi:prepilin-type processing-associated H-X9-DG protein